MGFIVRRSGMRDPCLLASVLFPLVCVSLSIRVNGANRRGVDGVLPRFSCFLRLLVRHRRHLRHLAALASLRGSVSHDGQPKSLMNKIGGVEDQQGP